MIRLSAPRSVEPIGTSVRDNLTVTGAEAKQPAAPVAVAGIVVAMAGGVLGILAAVASHPATLTVLAVVLFVTGIAVATAWAWRDSRRSGQSFGASTWRAARAAANLVFRLSP